VSDDTGQELPKGWTQATIEDLFWPLEDGRTLHQGWSPQCEKIPAPTDEDWGVLKTTAIQAGAFLPEHNKHLPPHLEPRSQIEVKNGDILITCAGPRVRCGVACLVRNTRPRLMMSGKMYRFRVPPEHIDARYLEAYLLTPRAGAAIDKMKTGGSDSGLNLTHDRFRRLPVPVAPLREQRRIMDMVEELLSDLDAGVAAVELVRAKLKHYRAAVLKAAVEGALTADWRAQHPAIEPASALLTRILAERRRCWEEGQLAKFQAAGKTPPKDWEAKYPGPTSPDTMNLPPLPEEWSWTTLDSLFVAGPQNGAYFPGERYGSGTPILRIDDYQNGWARDVGDLRRVSASNDDVELYALRADDLVINRVNSMTHIGKCLVVSNALAGCLFESNMMRSSFSSLLVPTFIEAYLHSSSGRQRLIKGAKWAVNQASINQQDVKRTAVPLPPLAEQAAIVEAVEDQLSVIEHLEGDLEAKLKSAQALRQSILRHAFTGQLVPQDPNDEPAAELLKRIAIEREDLARQARAAKLAKRKTKTARNRAARA
jgi:type I restriction enzyme S subunit